MTITRHQNTERIRRYHYNVDVNNDHVKAIHVGYKDFLPGDLEYELYKQKLIDMKLWNYQEIKDLVQKVLNT